YPVMVSLLRLQKSTSPTANPESQRCS
ncbi:phage tail protein, partial [Shigella sonnei]|nr:phage tail protein [Shigella sonnei]EFX2655153.1 phage tail protein [Shigella sonnei]EFX7038752.1 phage tail protein [Shigella sonnei]EFX7043046.1 phage tail protein [Shigella sonnei]EFX7055971.1 phage tail protein [Shigella sonnei]